ncbi:Alpha/Beta hydrolase protein, partial [Schizothecium vesticola]
MALFPPNATPLERQSLYAAHCQTLTSSLTAPGARDHHLLTSLSSKTSFTVPSPLDGHPIPVIRYTHLPSSPTTTPTLKTIILYLHGGGLHVGTATTEELSILHMLTASSPSLEQAIEIYSPSYRLLPHHPAVTALSDCAAVLSHLLTTQPPSTNTKLILAGSSSGGQLAALLSQLPDIAPRLAGVLLRGPVTSDAFSGVSTYVPAQFHKWHTSALEPSFRNSLLGVMNRAMPRDGLARMPLEAGGEVLRGLPRTWMQMCTNDALYSDGVCYAIALEEAGVEVRGGV